jgi:hypothetical protein
MSSFFAAMAQESRVGINVRLPCSRRRSRSDADRASALCGGGTDREEPSAFQRVGGVSGYPSEVAAVVT